MFGAGWTGRNLLSRQYQIRKYIYHWENLVPEVDIQFQSCFPTIITSFWLHKMIPSKQGKSSENLYVLVFSDFSELHEKLHSSVPAGQTKLSHSINLLFIQGGPGQSSSLSFACVHRAEKKAKILLLEKH